MNLDGLIAHVGEVARAQHGLIRTDQVPLAERDRLRYLARRGVIGRVAKGVYRVSGAPRTWRQDLQAGVWALGPTCTVSHRAAARLHGFEGFGLDVVEFTIGRSCRGRRPAGVPCTVHTTIDRRPGDRVHIDGLGLDNLTPGGVAGLGLGVAGSRHACDRVALRWGVSRIWVSEPEVRDTARRGWAGAGPRERARPTGRSGRTGGPNVGGTRGRAVSRVRRPASRHGLGRLGTGGSGPDLAL